MAYLGISDPILLARATHSPWNYSDSFCQSQPLPLEPSGWHLGISIPTETQVTLFARNAIVAQPLSWVVISSGNLCIADSKTSIPPDLQITALVVGRKGSKATHTIQLYYVVIRKPPHGIEHQCNATQLTKSRFVFGIVWQQVLQSK